MPPPAAETASPPPNTPQTDASKDKFMPIKQDMTENQHKSLLTLRERVDDIIEPVMSNNSILRRFLVARDYDIRLAEQLLRKTMKWRVEFGVTSLNRDGEIHTALKLNIIEVWKHTDIYKRPVLLMTPSRINPKFKGCDPMDIVKVVISKVEDAVNSMENGVESLVVIVDFHDFGMRNVTFDPLRELISILQDRYPERMGALFLVDSPFIFNAVWTIASPWVDERTRNKIHFVSDMSELSSLFTKDTIPPQAMAPPTIDAWLDWSVDDATRERAERGAIKFAREDAERRQKEAEEEEEERARIEEEDLEAKMNYRRSRIIDTMPELPPMQTRQERAAETTVQEQPAVESSAGKRRGSGGWRRSLRLVRGSLQRSSSVASIGSITDGIKPDAAPADGEKDKKQSRRQSIIFRWRKAAVDAATEQGHEIEDQLRAELGIGGDEKEKEPEDSKPRGILRRNRTFSDGEDDVPKPPKGILRRGSGTFDSTDGAPKGILRQSGTFDAPSEDVHPDALLRINTERNRQSGKFDAPIPPEEEEKQEKPRRSSLRRTASATDVLKDEPKSILRQSGTFEAPKLDAESVHPDALLRINTERNRQSGKFDAPIPPEEEEKQEKPRRSSLRRTASAVDVLKDEPRSILRQSGTFEAPKLDAESVHPDALLRINTERNRQSGKFDATVPAEEEEKQEKPRRSSLRRAASATDVLKDEPRSILRQSGTFEAPKLDAESVHPDALLRINTERNRQSGKFEPVTEEPKPEPEKPKGILRRSGTFDSIDVAKPPAAADTDSLTTDGAGGRRGSRRLSLRFSAGAAAAKIEEEKKKDEKKKKEEEEKKVKRVSTTTIRSVDIERRVVAPVITTEETEFRAPPKLPGKGPVKSNKANEPSSVVAGVDSTEGLEEMLSPEWADRQERQEREAMDAKRREMSERKRESINVLRAAVTGVSLPPVAPSPSMEDRHASVEPPHVPRPSMVDEVTPVVVEEEEDKGEGVGDDKPKHESYADASVMVASVPEQEQEFRAPPRRGSRGSLRGSLSMPKRLPRPSMAIFHQMTPSDTALEDEIRREAADAAREAASSAPSTAVVGEGGAKVHDRRRGSVQVTDDKRKSAYNLQMAMAQVATEEGVGLNDLERDIQPEPQPEKRRMSRRFSLMFKGAAKRALEQAKEEEENKKKEEVVEEEEDPLTSEKTDKKKRRASIFDAFRKKRISELVVEAADSARAEEESARAAAHSAKMSADESLSAKMVVEDAGSIKWIPEGYAVDFDRSWAAQPPEIPLEDALDSEPDVEVDDEEAIALMSNVLPSGGRKRADTRTPGRHEAIQRRQARIREDAVRDIERTLREKEARVKLLMRQRVKRRRKERQRQLAQKQAEDSVLGSVVSSLASLVEWGMGTEEESEASDSGTDSDALSDVSLDEVDLDRQAARRRLLRDERNEKAVEVDPMNDVEVAAASVIPTYYDLTRRGFMSGTDFFYTPKELAAKEQVRREHEERVEREAAEAAAKEKQEKMKKAALARRERLKAEVEKKLMEQHDLLLKDQMKREEDAKVKAEAEAELQHAEELAAGRRARQMEMAKQKVSEGVGEVPVKRTRSSSLTFEDDVSEGSHTEDYDKPKHIRTPSPPPKLGVIDWSDDEDEDEDESDMEETPLQRRLRLANRGGSPPPPVRKVEEEEESSSDDEYGALSFDPSSRHE